VVKPGSRVHEIMLEDFLIIIAGFAILLWGADRFVLGASAIADNLGISPLVIG